MAPALSTFSFPMNKNLLFDYWLSRQPTYPFGHPRNPERDREEIRQLDGYVRSLQRIRSSSQRDHNLAAAKQCRQWTSWRLFRFHDLPEDVILNIFEIGTFGGSRTSPMNAFRVSQVCKEWRKVAHRASSLWSSIAFEDNASLIRHFVERSRAYPLTIEINITDTEFDYENNRFWPEENHLDGCMSILIAQAYRWRSFRCVTDNRDPIAGVLRHLDHAQFPMLRSLELYQAFPHEDRVVARPLMSLFASTPRSLSSLNLSGVAVNWKCLSNLHLHLTEFSLNSIPLDEQPTVSEYSDMLYACRNSLRKLSLVNSGPLWNEDFPVNICVISFSNLEHFEFRGNSENGYNLDYLSSLLSVMEFGPALLTLTLTHFMDETDFDSFIPALSCRFSRVECLHIGHMSITDLQVACWLSVLSKVRTLYLHGLQFQEAVVRVLNTHPRQYGIRDVLCPALTTLFPFWPEFALKVLIAGRIRIRLPLTTLIWDVNLRKIVETIPYLQDVSTWIKVKFEGELRNPAERWVGPNLEEGSMDVEMLVDVSKLKDDQTMTAAQKHFNQVAGWRIVI